MSKATCPYMHSKHFGDEDLFIAGDMVCESAHLVAAFSRSSTIGFAVLDKKLRYQAINNCLARINGIPPEAHLGVTVREIFGEPSARTAEPSYGHVLAHGEMSHFEITNVVLPTRPRSRYWALNTNFPIRDRAGRVQQIGTMVVEVTQQRTLEIFLGELADKLNSLNTKETFWLVRELQDSIDQYHTALTRSFEFLIQRAEQTSELLARSVEVLDQRILTMKALVCDVASRFPIDQHPAGLLKQQEL